MTLDAMETSVYDGAPIELYEFDQSGINFWRYTSTDENVTKSGSLYKAIPIARSKLELSRDINRADLRIKMPVNAEFVQQFISYPPTNIMNFKLKRYHYGDSEVITTWVGRVVNVEFKNSKTAEVLCEHALTSMQRPTLRYYYQITCPFVLYDEETCTILAADKRVNATLSAVSGVTLTSGDFGLGDGYFTGGYVELTSGGVTQVRFITDHVGNDITVNLPLPGAVASAAVSAYPGCDHTLITCKDKFANNINYGGFVGIPDVNPMGGSPIY